MATPFALVTDEVADLCTRRTGDRMRAPWTVVRDARTGMRPESDDYVDRLRLRRERIELRAVVAVAVVGLVILGRRPNVLDRIGPMPGPVTLLVVMMGTYLVATAVARARYADSPNPEAERAEALRSLMMLPAALVVTFVLYWYIGGNLDAALIWLAIVAPPVTVALVVRYRTTARAARHATEDDELRVTGPGGCTSVPPPGPCG